MDAEDPAAEAFYEHFDFTKLHQQPSRLFAEEDRGGVVDCGIALGACPEVRVVDSAVPRARYRQAPWWTYGSLRDLAAQQRLRAGKTPVVSASLQSGLGDFSDTVRTPSVGLASVGVR